MKNLIRLVLALGLGMSVYILALLSVFQADLFIVLKILALYGALEVVIGYWKWVLHKYPLRIMFVARE